MYRTKLPMALAPSKLKIVKKLRTVVKKNAKAATAAKAKASVHKKAVKKAQIRIKKLLK